MEPCQRPVDWKNPRFYFTLADMVAIGVVNLVESVVYVILAALSTLIFPISKAPLHFFVKLLSSASFTTIWLIVSATLHIIVPHSKSLLNLVEDPTFVESTDNLVPRNFLTKEAFMRSVLSDITKWDITRETDKDFTAQWVRSCRNARMSIAEVTQVVPIVKQTYFANFDDLVKLLRAFYNPLDRESREVLLDGDFNRKREYFAIRPFIYYGLDKTGRKLPIPDCLHADSKEKIKLLRQVEISPVIQEVVDATASLGRYVQSIKEYVSPEIKRFARELAGYHRVTYEEMKDIVYFSFDPVGRFFGDFSEGLMEYSERLNVRKLMIAKEKNLSSAVDPATKMARDKILQAKIDRAKLIQAKIIDLRALAKERWHEEAVERFISQPSLQEVMGGLSNEAKAMMQELTEFSYRAERDGLISQISRIQIGS